MRTTHRPVLIGLCAVMLVACAGDGEGSASAQTPGSTTSLAPSSVKYTKMDTPNAEGFAKVTAGEGETHAEGIIDAKGVEIIPPRTSVLVNDITGSTALVQSGRAFLFVDLANGPIDTSLLSTETGFEYAEPFRCGRAMVKVNDRWFYIDTAGNRLFGTDFDFAETFHGDRAMVMQGEKYRIIDTEGRTVADMHYDQVNLQSPWCWQVTRIKGDVYWSGFVDLNGKELTPLIYDEVGYYDLEVKRIRVGKGDKYGFLDERAQVAIPVIYEQAEIFNHGKARVMLNGRDFFIDPNGKEVVE